MPLTLQRRHTTKCPDRDKGLNFLKCRGGCPFRISGTDDKGRVRETLKIRDYARAMRKYNAFVDERAGITPQEATRKKVADAIDAYMAQKSRSSEETRRKYRRILNYLQTFLTDRGIHNVCDVRAEMLDEFRLWRNKDGWTWVKESEILKAFFAFCLEREWAARNPARGLVVDIPEEANDVTPYNEDEIVKILRACNEIGRGSYERLRARAMVLVMRFAGLRLSDVVTLSRDHIQGRHLVKKTVKNRKVVNIKLPETVLQALDMVPHPKGAAKDCKLFFASGNASVRSLVKGAWRTLSRVFERAGVERAHPHKFRHTLASELLGKGESIEIVSHILGDTPATIRRHYAKTTPEYQSRLDEAIGKIHGVSTKLTHEDFSAVSVEMKQVGVVARDGIGLTPHTDSTELTDSTFDVEGLNSPDRQSLTQNWHKSERSPVLRSSLENKKPRGGRGSCED